VAERSIDTAHRINFSGTSKLCTDTRYMDRLIEEPIEIRLHPNNLNRDEGFSLSPSPSHITVDGQSTSPSWCRAPSGAHGQTTYVTGLTDRVLVSWGAPSDKGAGLSFV
jgi:hypothetical protein